VVCIAVVVVIFGSSGDGIGSDRSVSTNRRWQVYLRVSMRKAFSSAVCVCLSVLYPSSRLERLIRSIFERVSSHYACLPDA
jgi:hypothetical protein